MIITYSIFWYLQMSKDFIFAWVTRTIYEPFFLLKFNFNIETFGSRKITILLGYPHGRIAKSHLYFHFGQT